jgi:hypothetical protein
MRRLGLLAAIGIVAAVASACSGDPGGQGTALKHIGILMPVTAEDPTGRERETVFLEAMQERGWLKAAI